MPKRGGGIVLLRCYIPKDRVLNLYGVIQLTDELHTNCYRKLHNTCLHILLRQKQLDVEL